MMAFLSFLDFSSRHFVLLFMVCEYRIADMLAILGLLPS